jgi:hypothetical protein
MSKIKAFGYEIEGEFSTSFEKKLIDVGEMKGDGSLRNCPFDDAFHVKHNLPSIHTAEFNSEVFSYDNPKEVEAGVYLFEVFQKAYEKGLYHWNKSCGFHVHISFTPKFPVEIFSKQFYDYFMGKMKAVYPKEYKARRNNSFCKDNVEENEIAYDGERHASINFKTAMRTHGTIEFRIFPANSPKKMKEYLQFVLKEVGFFLKNIVIDESFVCEISTDHTSTEEITANIKSSDVNIKEYKLKVENKGESVVKINV